MIAILRTRESGECAMLADFSVALRTNLRNADANIAIAPHAG